MFPFEVSTTISISGTTGAGKSTLAYKLLKHKDKMFATPPVKVLWCYAVDQPLYSKIRDEMPFVTFYQGIPTVDMIEEFSDGNQNCILIDDQMDRVAGNGDIARLFSVGSHHRKLLVIYINQNLFRKNTRDIALSTHYQILMKNPRDLAQITYFARQVFPGQTKEFMDAYRDCMKSEEVPYLVVNLSPFGREEERIRTNILPNQTTVLYNLDQ